MLIIHCWYPKCICTITTPQGTIHKGRPQNVRDFCPPAPYPHLVMIYSTKSTQPLLLRHVLDNSPPSVLTSYVNGPLHWKRRREELLLYHRVRSEIGVSVAHKFAPCQLNWGGEWGSDPRPRSLLDLISSKMPGINDIFSSFQVSPTQNMR